MERNFYDDEFEDFLKQKADQCKLYPSDRVWNDVYAHFHSGRKWHVLTGTLLLITTLVFISLEIVSSGYNNIAYNVVNDSIVNSRTAHSSIASTHSSIIKTGKPTAVGASTLLIAHTSFNPLLLNEQKENKPTPYDHHQAISIMNPERLPAEDELLTANEATLKEKMEKPSNDVNWLQDRAVLKLSPKRPKLFNVQLYFSPTVSYRRLQNYNEQVTHSEGGSGSIASTSTTLMDMEGVVDHRPSVGMELGSALFFNVSKRFALKTGLQLNYVRYNIKAYRSNPEKTSITLSSAGPSGRTETITTYSSIRNLNGNSPRDLQNQYLQISLPVGGELKLLGNERLQLNIAGTIQPTYLLHSNAYLLSSDFKSYIKEPSLVRKWNVNTEIESYISYNVGDFRWQFGPQFRYQLLSSYTDRYSMREYLMEYGFKFGVIKTLK